MPNRGKGGGSYKASALFVALSGIGIRQIIIVLAGRASAIALELVGKNLSLLGDEFGLVGGHLDGDDGGRVTAIENTKGGRPGYYYTANSVPLGCSNKDSSTGIA
jgi:hypothetical protein